MSNGAIWPAALTAGALMGMLAAWWLSRGGWKIFRRADEPLSQRVDELTLEVVDLRLELSEVKVGTAKLIAQLEAAEIEPVYRLPSGRRQQMEDESDATRLHRLLVKHFSLEELDEIAVAAGVPAESYGGSTRPARALALVQVASRHGRLEDLVGAARRARPGVRWPRIRREVGE